MNLLDFFRALYTDYPDALYLWTMPEKATRVFLPSQLRRWPRPRCASQPPARTYISASARGRDARQVPASEGRRDTQHSRAVVRHRHRRAGHAAQNLPPDIQSAEGLLPPGLLPSVVVDSGHGLHAYWLFKEPWDIDGDSERAEAVNTLRRLQGYARREAAKRGWTVTRRQTFRVCCAARTR